MKRGYFFSMRDLFGCDTLEAMHRMSWRHYAVALLMPLLFSFGTAVECFAAETAATEKRSAFEAAKEAVSKLVSKEGELKSVTKKPAAGKHVPKVILPPIEKAEEEAEGEMRTLKGTVSARSSYGVAVEYGSDPKLGTREMWADFRKQTLVAGIKKFSDLEPGDQVQIKYKELKENSKKILKEIKLLKKAPKEAASQDERTLAPPSRTPMAQTKAP